MTHEEDHKIARIGFLRAAVLGANDGIISTSSLIIGVCSSGADQKQIITVAIAGLVAGALSMAAGEYVSVSSQSDTEKADIERERKELLENPKHELLELENIYIQRGLDSALAKEVASQLTKHNALDTHIRDELGILEINKANPLTASIASALTFATGASLPVMVTYFTSTKNLILFEAAFSLVFLFVMGGIAAKSGGAHFTKGALRVAFWGAIAMGFTALVGKFFNVSL
ncbi:MAG: VIT family protein [Bacteriovoracaceae bacterium]|nr:VIT family protein [Bacteriovoracaceae bacterium]